MQTMQANNSRIFRIQKAKCSGHHFYTKTNIWRDFPICISAPLKRDLNIGVFFVIIAEFLRTSANSCVYQMSFRHDQSEAI